MTTVYDIEKAGELPQEMREPPVVEEIDGELRADTPLGSYARDLPGGLDEGPDAHEIASANGSADVPATLPAIDTALDEGSGHDPDLHIVGATPIATGERRLYEQALQSDADEPPEGPVPPPQAS
jgi:hypothetical protein